MRRQRTSQGREWGGKKGGEVMRSYRGKEQTGGWVVRDWGGGAAGRRTVREKMDDENVR